MRFVLVNERSPRRQAFCVSCDEPIGAGYLREIGTHLTYCNHDCYESIMSRRYPRFAAPTSRKESPSRSAE